MNRAILVVLLVVCLLGLPLAVTATPAEDATPDLVRALSGLRSGPALVVTHRPDEVTIQHGARVLLSAAPRLLEVRGPDAPSRPDPGQRAVTEVVEDAQGRLIYSTSVTSRGARVTVLGAGQVHPQGLHFTAFDNDDVHVADGQGALVFSRTNLADGTLVERAGASYGCGCEERTDPDGRVTVRPLE